MGTLPVWYLGIPLITTKLKAADCMELVDRITSRIWNWTAKFLSYAGRLQLIQSVLFGINSFWTSLLILPKSIILRIERIIRAYLWRGNDDRGGGAKVAWADVTCPKKEGGLGLKRLEEWNKALMAKHLWKLCQPFPTSSWAKWAKANLLRGRSLWDINVPQNYSWNWRKILKLREVFRPYVRHVIGDGEDTWLWFDYWLPPGPLQQLYGNRIIYDSGLSRQARVAKIIVNNN